MRFYNRSVQQSDGLIYYMISYFWLVLWMHGAHYERGLYIWIYIFLQCTQFRVRRAIGTWIGSPSSICRSQFERYGSAIQHDPLSAGCLHLHRYLQYSACATITTSLTDSPFYLGVWIKFCTMFMAAFHWSKPSNNMYEAKNRKNRISSKSSIHYHIHILACPELWMVPPLFGRQKFLIPFAFQTHRS